MDPIKVEQTAFNQDLYDRLLKLENDIKNNLTAENCSYFTNEYIKLEDELYNLDLTNNIKLAPDCRINSYNIDKIKPAINFLKTNQVVYHQETITMDLLQVSALYNVVKVPQYFDGRNCFINQTYDISYVVTDATEQGIRTYSALSADEFQNYLKADSDIYTAAIAPGGMSQIITKNANEVIISCTFDEGIPTKFTRHATTASCSMTATILFWRRL